MQFLSSPSIEVSGSLSAGTSSLVHCQPPHVYSVGWPSHSPENSSVWSYPKVSHCSSMRWECTSSAISSRHCSWSYSSSRRGAAA